MMRQITLELPEAIFRQAEQAATETQCSVETLLVDSLTVVFSSKDVTTENQPTAFTNVNGKSIHRAMSDKPSAVKPQPARERLLAALAHSPRLKREDAQWLDQLIQDARESSLADELPT